MSSKPMNLSQEWVTKVTSQDGDSPSVIGPPGIPDLERWVLQLNWYHSSDCTVKQPSAQCSCGLHALKSQIRQAHTDLEAEAERLTRCLAACDSGDCECPKQDETECDPELKRLGLPQSWTRACEYALKVVPNGMDDTDRTAGGHYMDVRNAYVAGAEGDDDFRVMPKELRSSEKSGDDSHG